MGIGSIISGVASIGSAIFGHSQAKKQAQAEAAAAERARLASATVQAVTPATTTDSSDAAQVSETNAASKKKRRYGMNRTVSNAGMSTALTGKSTLG